MNKYLQIDEFRAALASFYDGNKDKENMILSLASSSVQGDPNGIYFLKDPYKTSKKINKDSPFNRFKELLEEYEETALLIFLCGKFSQRRMNIGASWQSLKDRVSIDDIDDARISNAFEKELVRVIGKNSLTLAKRMLAGLFDVIPEDTSGQLRKVAMDLVAVEFQIDNEVRAQREFREDSFNKGKPIPKSMNDTLKDLRSTREKMMGLLGITAKDIEKKRGNSKTGFMKAAESLTGKIDDANATSNLIEDTKTFLDDAELDFPEKVDSFEGKSNTIDEIDLALIKEPAGEITEEDAST